MRNNFEKRLSANNNRQARATTAFQRLEDELLAASKDHRELHDELESEIQRLEALRIEAMNAGIKANQQAKRVRETFLT